MREGLDGRLTRESYEDFRRRWTAGEFKGQRYGQAFGNTFGHANNFNMTDFYYETDDAKSQAAIDQILRDYQL